MLPAHSVGCVYQASPAHTKPIPSLTRDDGDPGIAFRSFRNTIFAAYSMSPMKPIKVPSGGGKPVNILGIPKVIGLGTKYGLEFPPPPAV